MKYTLKEAFSDLKVVDDLDLLEPTDRIAELDKDLKELEKELIETKKFISIYEFDEKNFATPEELKEYEEIENEYESTRKQIQDLKSKFQSTREWSERRGDDVEFYSKDEIFDHKLKDELQPEIDALDSKVTELW